MSEQSFHLVCPHCQAINRVPAARLSAAPKCGKCGQPLLTASPHELNAQTANKVIQKNDVLTIVDFWASWCQPCIMMAPEFKSAASQLPQVVFAKVQTDKYEQAAAPYNIRSLPTMVAFRNGKEVARQSGALPNHPMGAKLTVVVLVRLDYFFSKLSIPAIMFSYKKANMRSAY